MFVERASGQVQRRKRSGLPWIAKMLRGAAALALASTAAGHGAVTQPGPPRQAVDSNIPPWSNGVPARVPFEYMCPFPTINEAAKSGGKRNLSATNGQACFCTLPQLRLPKLRLR